MAMTVSMCCCGCSLRTGTIGIARFLLVCSLLSIFSSCRQLYVISTTVVDQSDTNVELQNQLKEINQIKEDVKVGLIIGIVGATVQLFLNILLHIGVSKDQRIPVIIWLVAYSVFCGLGVLLLVISFFLVILDVIMQIALGINIVLYLYFLLVVWSFHKSTEAGYNRQPSAADVYNNENWKVEGVPPENLI